MAIIVKEDGQAFDQLPAGTYLARCYGVVLLGTNYDKMYDKTQTKVAVQFEFPTELIESESSELNGQPYGLSKFYTLSLHEKANLRIDLEQWRNRKFTEDELLGFDLVKIIGAPCMVSVIMSEKGKPKVGSVSALPKGTNILPQINPTRYFDLEDFEKFDDLPKGFQKMVKESQEYIQRFGTGEPFDDANELPPDTSAPVPMEDDIPF